MNTRISPPDPLDFLLKTIDENSKFYGKAVLKAALVRDKEEIFLYLAEISFPYKSDKELQPEFHDYGNVILLKEVCDHDSIKNLISNLSSGSVSINKFSDVKTEGGFQGECYHTGSLTRYAGMYFDWPFLGFVYSLSHNTSLNGVYDPLTKPGSPLFPSLYEAIPSFFNSEYSVNQNNPVFVNIFLPNYKAKIKSLILAENQATINVVTRESQMENLIVKLFCKRQENSFNSDDVSLNADGTAEIIMPFVPDIVHCYLLDKKTGDSVDSKSYGKWYTDRNDGVEIRTSKETVEGMIAKGETEQIEFKMDLLGKTDEFLETIVSFANSTGGVILLGVHNDRRIIGIEDDLDKMDKRIRSLVANRCEPDISLIVEPIQIDSRTIIAVRVNEGNNKPYLLVGKSAYKRVLKDDYPFTRHDFDIAYSKKDNRDTLSGFST